MHARDRSACRWYWGTTVESADVLFCQRRMSWFFQRSPTNSLLVMRPVESTRPNGVKMTLASGEPNRVMNKTTWPRQKNMKCLGHSVMWPASHACKICYLRYWGVWLGSCNLLSSATGSQNSEVGVLIQDVNATFELLDLIMPWFRKQERNHSTHEEILESKKKNEPVPEHLLAVRKIWVNSPILVVYSTKRNKKFSLNKSTSHVLPCTHSCVDRIITSWGQRNIAVFWLTPSRAPAIPLP